MRSDPLQPPFFAPTRPQYPLVRQMVSPAFVDGSVYLGHVQQWDGSAFREREFCYVWEGNGVSLTLSKIYRGRLIGSYTGSAGTLPLFFVGLKCCTQASSGSPSPPTPTKWYCLETPSSSSVSPAPPVPGTTCDKAYYGTENVKYTFALGTDESAWFKFGPITDGDTYHVSGTYPIGVGEPYILVYEGSDCDNLPISYAGGTSCQELIKFGTGYVWVQFDVWDIFAPDYSLTFGTGPCPP